MARKKRTKKAHSQDHVKLPFSSVVIFSNNKSTNAARADELALVLARLIGNQKFYKVNISGCNPDEIMRKVEDNRHLLGPHVLVGMGGGDGTCSSIIQAMVRSKILNEMQRASLLLPLWGGNANDLAVMLNGPVNVKVFRKLLTTVKPLAIHPLKITLRDKDGTLRVRTAACYASFGATAEALNTMEGSSHKRGKYGPKTGLVRLGKEAVDVFRVLSGIQPFKVLSGQQREVEMLDRLFVNGPRYAKVLHAPVELEQKAYFESTTQRGGVHLLVQVVKSFAGRGHGRVNTKMRRFIITNATMAQIDGELLEIKPHTKVTVSVNPVAFKVLSKHNKVQQT